MYLLLKKIKNVINLECNKYIFKSTNITCRFLNNELIKAA